VIHWEAWEEVAGAAINPFELPHPMMTTQDLG